MALPRTPVATLPQLVLDALAAPSRWLTALDDGASEIWEPFLSDDEGAAAATA